MHSKQSNSDVSFRQRAGIITASKFKAAYQTDITQPSKSRIKGTCYPNNSQFKSVATEWGYKREKIALSTYTFTQKANHSDCSVIQVDLFINLMYSHLGASPDGIVSFVCCGNGSLEVKCPFPCRDKGFLDAATECFFSFLARA